MHTPELVLFHLYLHPDLCLEKKLQKGTGHVNLMTIVQLREGIQCHPPTTSRNTGLSSFSNTVCPQRAEEGLSLSFLRGQGVYWVHVARSW